MENFLAIPGALLLATCILARFIGPFVRSHIRPRLLRIVLSQLDFVSRLQQRLRKPVLDVLAKLTALSVSVEFYLISLPPVVWLGGSIGTAAMMAVCQCMAVSTYMTCALKDLLSCPRPGPASSAAVAAQRAKEKAAGLAAAGKAEDSPGGATRNMSNHGPSHRHHVGVTAGVEVLESAYRGEVEMGAPSMHTWCALVMPSYATAVAAQLGALSPTRAAGLTAAAVCWAAWVALSRLYLGVHTPVDLVLGGACGAAVLGLWRQIGLAQIAAVADPAVAAATAAAAAAAGRSGWWAAWLPTAAGSAQAAGEGAGGSVGSLVALAAVGALYVLALATYPRPMSHTTSYEYAVIFLGAAYGGLVSTSGWFRVVPPLACGLSAPQATSPFEAVVGFPSPALLRHPAAVVLLGFVTVALVKEVSKAILSFVLPRLLGLAPLGLRRTWQPPVHPAGCWRPDLPVPEAAVTATVTAVASVAPSAEPKLSPPCVDGGGGGDDGRGDGRRIDGGGAAAGAGGGGVVLMKTARLAYDVDFLRKFLNYGLTVYAVVEFRYVAAALLCRE